jgi:hypothetical protein
MQCSTESQKSSVTNHYNSIVFNVVGAAAAIITGASLGLITDVAVKSLSNNFSITEIATVIPLTLVRIGLGVTPREVGLMVGVLGLGTYLALKNYPLKNNSN